MCAVATPTLSSQPYLTPTQLQSFVFHPASVRDLTCVWCTRNLPQISQLACHRLPSPSRLPLARLGNLSLCPRDPHYGRSLRSLRPTILKIHNPYGTKPHEPDRWLVLRLRHYSPPASSQPCPQSQFRLEPPLPLLPLPPPIRLYRCLQISKPKNIAVALQVFLPQCVVAQLYCARRPIREALTYLLPLHPLFIL
jgi:hypothetical protein